MAFLILLISVWIVLWALSKAGIGKLDSHSFKGRVAFSAGFVFIGFSHLLKPEELIYMIEEFLPHALLIVYLTGVIEILLAVFLQIRRYQKITAWIIIAYLIAIFPANINVGVNNLPPPGGLPASPWYTGQDCYSSLYIYCGYIYQSLGKRKSNSIS